MRKKVHAVIAAAAFLAVLSGVSDRRPLWPGGLSGPTTARAAEDDEPGSVTKLKVEPLHKAVRITWKSKLQDGKAVTFEIHRSMVSPEGQYTLVEKVPSSPDAKKYTYVDKKLPVEENYFYKIVVPETNETFGPIQVRPPFSLPTT